MFYGFGNVFCHLLLSSGFKDLFIFPLFLLPMILSFLAVLLSSSNSQFSFSKMDVLFTFITFNKKTSSLLPIITKWMMNIYHTIPSY